LERAFIRIMTTHHRKIPEILWIVFIALPPFLLYNRKLPTNLLLSIVLLPLKHSI